jgi:hypothetical protein
MVYLVSQAPAPTPTSLQPRLQPCLLVSYAGSVPAPPSALICACFSPRHRDPHPPPLPLTHSGCNHRADAAFFFDTELPAPSAPY